MWSSILHAYHDGFADEGSVEALRKRAVDAILRSGTSLLLIDEVQHLFYRSKDGLAATDAFKRLLDAGVTSLALLGDEEVAQLVDLGELDEHYDPALKLLRHGRRSRAPVSPRSDLGYFSAPCRSTPRRSRYAVPLG